MDALAQLALMTKAKLVFESADTFLSFPALTPISYTPEQLKFAEAASSAEMQVFSEFSTLANALPQGTLFQPSLDHVLWDVYQGVLQNAQLAEGSLTAQQTADLQAAQTFLSAPGADGLLTDSPAVVAYKQYQQAWFAATQNYNNQKITAMASSDPNVQSLWQSSGEPLARAQVQAAESDWETKGFKAQVEQAQQTEQTYAAQSPQLKWQSWTALCNPAIDFLTDPATNATFGPTVFAPYDIIDQGSWPSFSIAGADIPNLIKQAPPELQSIFGTTTGNSTIDSMSFEYCSVALSRTWFRPELFAARFWRLPDATVQLSDGNVPPAGSWPAYITAMVLARNIVVTSRVAGAVQPQPVRGFPPLMVSNLHLEPPPAARPMPVVLRPQIAVAPRPPVTQAPVIAQHPLMAMRAAAPMRTAVPMTAFRATVGVPRPVPEDIAINPALKARLGAATFPGRFGGVIQRPPTPVPVTPTPTQPAPPPPPTTQTQSSGAQISVLAFICKRLPLCPNPDPSLNWGGDTAGDDNSNRLSRRNYGYTQSIT